MNKKIIAIILAVVVVTVAVVLGVVLGNKTPEDTKAPEGTTLGKDEMAGIVLINAGGSVEILYNVDGAAISVAGFGANGMELAKEMDTAVGKPCKDIVGVITQKAVDLGYVTEKTKMIVIKDSAGSYLPSEDYLELCAAEVKKIVENVNVVVLGAKDLNPNGYISLESCQVLLKKYLNLSGDVTFDGPTNPYGSKYYLSSNHQEGTAYYTVDASDGSIRKCSKEDFESISTMGFIPGQIEEGSTTEESVDPEFLVTVAPTQ